MSIINSEEIEKNNTNNNNMFNLILSNERDKFYINYLFSKMELCKNDDLIIKTRNQLLRTTSSCRLWQLFYCVCDLFLSDGKDIENTKIQQEICNIIYNRILKNKGSDFYNLIVNNIPNKLTDKITTRTEFINTSNVKTYYCCINIPQEKPGYIYHYFNLVCYHGSYYINNSYSSDYICVPQYVKILSGGLEEFLQFCEMLPRSRYNEDAKIFSEKFIRKYFLETLLSKGYDEDTIEEEPKYKFLIQGPEEGKQKEINAILDNMYDFVVSIIPSYEEKVKSFFPEDLKGGRRRRRKRKSRGKSWRKSQKNVSNRKTRKKNSCRRRTKKSQKSVSKRKYRK